MDGATRYDNELKARFCNEPDTEPTTPERRYQAVGYDRNAAGAALADFEKLDPLDRFEPTPRCLKCRVIHDYNIVGEDLQVKAVANKSCQYRLYKIKAISGGSRQRCPGQPIDDNVASLELLASGVK